MADNYGWVDPNTGDRLPIGVSGGVLTPLDATMQHAKQILALKPDWQTDGHGLRGPQPQRITPPNIPRASTRVTFNEKHGQDQGPSEGGTMSVADEVVGDFAEGETLVDPVDKITFDNRYFKIHDNGGGEVQVSLITDTCA